MPGSPTTKRYAQAAFQIAQEQGNDSAWLEELESAIVCLADPTVVAYMALPKVGASDRVQTIKLLLHDHNALLVNLIQLLISRRSLNLLPRIVKEYRNLLDSKHGRIRAEVVSAVDLSKEQQAKLREMLAKRYSKEVILEAKVDTGLVGGVLIRVGDEVLDGSVRTRIESLKQYVLKEAIA